MHFGNETYPLGDEAGAQRSKVWMSVSSDYKAKSFELKHVGSRELGLWAISVGYLLPACDDER